jgi:MerR family transcriptional regulator, copper efflux regulator
MSSLKNQESNASSQRSAPLSSGQLAAQTRLSRGAIRLYERHGLIKPEHRTDAGYRMFSADTVVTLNAIKVACKAGFTLAEVGALLGLVDEASFSPQAVQAALNQKIKEVDDRITHLQQFKRFMQQVAKNPEILLDPACDAMLELAALASTETKPMPKKTEISRKKRS